MDLVVVEKDVFGWDCVEDRVYTGVYVGGCSGCLCFFELGLPNLI